jgi:glycosyltransferase involved in cell wall biosynthesis
MGRIWPIKTEHLGLMPRHLVHILPTFAPGGVQIRLSYLMNHLDMPVRHTVIAMDGDFSCQSRVGSHVAVEYRPPPATGGLLSRLKAYRETLRTLKPDLLLTFQWGAVEWALANRFYPVAARHIHLESGFGADEAERQHPRRVWTRRLALGRIEKIIVPSKTLEAIAVRDWWVPAAKVAYIPNGVDCDKYARPPVPGSVPGFEKAAGEKIVGTLTPLRPEKNLSRLIRAFAVASGREGVGPARLLILGEGMERPKLETLARDLDIAHKVLLPGHCDAPDQALGWFDLYAISSDTEQMPNAVNQAMAAGKAVVGLDVGDVRHIVSEPNKPWIVPKGDEAAFADAMARLLQDDAVRQAVGAANAAHVRATYSLDGMLAAYRKAWG